MFSRYKFVLALLAVMLPASIVVEGQTKRKKTIAKKTTAEVASPGKKEALADEPPVEVSVKKNERPAKAVEVPIASPLVQNAEPEYRYEFTQPEFLTNRIIIEHNEQGDGTISFTRRNHGELFTDPIKVSQSAMKRLNDHFNALHFLDSNEEYQDKRDFSHLGSVSITRRKEGKQRSVSFNYTANKHAKALADNYRAIANQAMWVFDITVARENQPLESPNHMRNLESLIKRNEISDAEQMLPLLRELSDDERLPLIARNNALRIIQLVEKATRKQ